jgi:hypothetical protein
LNQQVGRAAILLPAGVEHAGQDFLGVRYAAAYFSSVASLAWAACA